MPNGTWIGTDELDTRFDEGWRQVVSSFASRVVSCRFPRSKAKSKKSQLASEPAAATAAQGRSPVCLSVRPSGINPIPSHLQGQARSTQRRQSVPIYQTPPNFHPLTVTKELKQTRAGFWATGTGPLRRRATERKTCVCSAIGIHQIHLGNPGAPPPIGPRQRQGGL